MKETKAERDKRILREQKKLAKIRRAFEPEALVVDNTMDIIVNKWRHKKPSIFREGLTVPEFEEFRNDLKSAMQHVYDEGHFYSTLRELKQALLHFQLDKIKAECERRRLPKGESVERKTKYEIALAVDMKPGKFSAFKSGGEKSRGQKVYRRISTALAKNGYHG